MKTEIEWKVLTPEVAGDLADAGGVFLTWERGRNIEETWFRRRGGQITAWDTEGDYIDGGALYDMFDPHEPEVKLVLWAPVPEWPVS